MDGTSRHRSITDFLSSSSASCSAACGTRTSAGRESPAGATDYPQADYNFMVRLAELTTTTISRWNNGDPGFANVTAMDPDLFKCLYLRMQNAANYDFTPEETARMH